MVPVRAQPILKALAIAEELKKADREAFEDIFAVINRFAKRKTEPALILGAAEALKREHAAGRKPRNLWEYFSATMRALQQQAEAARLRAGKKMEGAHVTEVLAEILRRSGYKIEKQQTDPSPSTGEGKGEGE